MPKTSSMWLNRAVSRMSWNENRSMPARVMDMEGFGAGREAVPVRCPSEEAGGGGDEHARARSREERLAKAAVFRREAKALTFALVEKQVNLTALVDAEVSCGWSIGSGFRA